MEVCGSMIVLNTFFTVSLDSEVIFFCLAS